MALVKRKVLDEIRPHLENPEITVITGPRQCDKTTILNNICGTSKRRTLWT